MAFQYATGSIHEPRSGFSGHLIEFVYALILVVTVIGWTAVGFVVWVPLLVRTTTLLAAAVFYATLFSDQARLTNAKESLSCAVVFYVRGFEHFVKFWKDRHKDQPPTGIFDQLKWRELLIECIWCLGIWTALYFISHSLLASFR